MSFFSLCESVQSVDRYCGRTPLNKRLLIVSFMLSLVTGNAVAEGGGIVAAAHPMAAEAGVAILDAGGNAMDAAVATAFVLSVVEPAASGLGGGGFLMWHPAGATDSEFLDFRERAPASLPVEAYTRDGELAPGSLKLGGPSVATPSMVRGLLDAHRRHGKLPLDQVLAPSIRAANDGVVVTPHLQENIADTADLLAGDPHLAALYLRDGKLPLAVGDVLRQPTLGATIARIATEGDAVLHAGAGAAAIVAATRARGGFVTEHDLADAKTHTWPPVVIHYKDYTLHAAPPPSSGGIELALVLGALDRYNFDGHSPNDPEVIALMMALGNEAQRQVRMRVADPATTPVDVAALTNAAAIDALIASVDWARADAPPVVLDALPDDGSLQRTSPGNTTHLSVLDRDGNAVSLTQTINTRFGAGIMVPELGVLLNNEMDDFSFDATSPNTPAPGKTPRSSMVPTIVLRDGVVVGVIGSPGGTRIPWAVVRTITGMLEFGLSLDEAIALPRFHVDSTRKEIVHEVRLEAATMDRAVSLLDGWGDRQRRALRDFDQYLGGVHAVWVDDATGQRMVVGGADPRRDGVVRVQQ